MDLEKITTDGTFLLNINMGVLRISQGKILFNVNYFCGLQHFGIAI